MIYHGCVLNCSLRKYKTIEIDKHTQVGTWYLFHLSLCLISPRTRDEVISLLYYAQDSVIQIDINNKLIPHAYDDQA